MKTKIKKRYNTANEIRDKIDEYKQKALRLVQQAEGLELSANELIKHPKMVEDALYKREQAQKARRAAQRIYEKRLPVLKQKLAEWGTNPMPFMEGDRSVPA